MPRFRPPCVWVLITGCNDRHPGTKSVFTTFETAKAALEPDALRIRALRLARKEEKAKAAAEKKAAKVAAKKARAK
ncbi:MAG: hypothetical protein Q8K32_09420 [Archangium sp.]|nr:hypothetical protein [Archangium sp.]